MSMLKKIELIGLSVIICLVFTIPVESADNTGKWGPNDQLGTLNYITPQVRLNAKKCIRSGKVFNLGIDIKKNMPHFPGRDFQFLTYEISDTDSICYCEDQILMNVQYSTHYDGLLHAGYNHKLYNGYPYSGITVSGGQKLGIHLWADKAVTRGVLLDVAKYKGKKIIEKGYIITSEDLQGTADKQGVEIKSGDFLLIRTGWIIRLLEQKWPMEIPELKALGEPGVGYDAAQWIDKKEIALVACDQTGFEPIPFDPIAYKKYKTTYPMHAEFIVKMGMPLGELFDLEALAKDCAEDGQYDFMIFAPPLKIIGGSGSPLSPIVIK